MDGTKTFDKDYQAFASPQPQPLPKYLALINPFSPLVWIIVVVSFFILAVVFWLVANWEGELQNLSYGDWSSMGNSLWFCYGTLIGESVTRDTKSSNAVALRLD